VGGALLSPQTLSIITMIFPQNSRGAAYGIWGAVAGLAAVAGPTVGGLLVTYIDWRWIFYVNVPVGIITLVAALLIVPDIRMRSQHQMDIPGAVLISVGLVGIVYGLVEGQRYNWGAVLGPVTIPEIIAAGVLVVAAFLIYERSQKEPLLPLSLFRFRNFSVAIWIAFVVTFALLGFFLPMTIFLQSVLGFTALKAGLTMIPMSVASLLVGPFAGRLADRFGGKWLLFGGLALFAAGMALVDYVSSLSATQLTYLGPVALAGIGMGMTYAPMTTVAMRQIAPQLAGAASGVLNTVNQLGGVLGSAVIGAVLQNQLAIQLHDQAVAYSSRIPDAFRSRFISFFDHAASSGFQVGVGQNGGAVQLPSQIPPAAAHQIEAIFRAVFANAYLNAIRPTMLVSVGVLLVGAMSALALKQLRGAAQGAWGQADGQAWGQQTGAAEGPAQSWGQQAGARQ
ncbi:MAG TPA: MFS transporter, partial [Candidatus Sulfotelmatobacter sp.]|nr:MFS transporter [Candidatus Sulfotelmatobacter sp.]